MMEVYALLLVCATNSACLEIRDRIDMFSSIEECNTKIEEIKRNYKATSGKCVLGDIVEDPTPRYEEV